MSSHKTFIVKRKLAKAQKQNRPLPQWFRMKTDNKIRYNAKRRHWRRTKLKFLEYEEVKGMNCLKDKNFYEEDAKIINYDRFSDRCIVSNERILTSKDYVIVLSTQESYYINPLQWFGVPSCVKNINKYQISYLYENMFLLRKPNIIKKAVGVSGEKLFNKICDNINDKLSNFLSSDPKEHRNVIRNVLRRFDVDGYVFEGKGYFKTCRIIEGNRVNDKKEIFGRCYKEMPITVGGKIKFTDNMIDIQNIGTPIDCKTKESLLEKKNDNIIEDDYDTENDEYSSTPNSEKFNFKGYYFIAFLILLFFQLLSIVVFISSTISYSKKSKQLEKLKKINREASTILLSKNNSLCNSRSKRNLFLNV
uniref:Large ribosomal subunit protein eL39 n=1 Tax=Strongyloides venezuelensis TaxID=75913 RepID=A0A0K0FU15_STRVS